ncbi:hypothetical protein C8R44DRAFT_880532 [Mycena epipterygia]|nr:hypothetical protein C8R44DRAFT_880532 [Mycena epipterygia]
MQTQDYDNSIQDDRRNRFLPDDGGGQRAASQPPAHHSAASFPRRSNGSPWGGLLSSSTRSASFSSLRFAFTLEDDKLVDRDDDIYDATTPLAEPRDGAGGQRPHCDGGVQNPGHAALRLARHAPAPLWPQHTPQRTPPGRARLASPDASSMSPFVRDVGWILLDDGSFRELWEHEHDSGLGGDG